MLVVYDTQLVLLNSLLAARVGLDQHAGKPLQLLAHPVHDGLYYPAVLLHPVLLDVGLLDLLGGLQEDLLAALDQLLVAIEEGPLEL